VFLHFDSGTPTKSVFDIIQHATNIFQHGHAAGQQPRAALVAVGNQGAVRADGQGCFVIVVGIADEEGPVHMVRGDVVQRQLDIALF